MEKFKLVIVDPEQSIETAIGTFKAKEITDEIADKIIARHGSQYYLQPIVKAEIKK